MSFSYWQRAERQSDLTCDVAVVGAGMLGASVAYWLKQARPEWHVIVVDAGTVAGGATGRSAGIVRQTAGPDYATLCRQVGRTRARQALQYGLASRAALLAEVRPSEMGYEDCGCLSVATSISEDRRLNASVSPLRADGLPAAHIPTASVNRRVQGQQFYGGIYIPSDGVCNPLQLVRMLLERSQARVLEHHAVERIYKRGDHAVLYTPQRRILAGQVAVTLHPGTKGLVGEGAWLQARHAYMLLTTPMERWLQLPVLGQGGQYLLRQLPQGGLMVGLWADADRPTTADEAYAAIRFFLNEHFPHTEPLGVQHHWHGQVLVTPDGLPVVGQAEALGRCFWAGGLGTDGLGRAFGVGRTLAHRMLTDRPSPDWMQFAAARFED